MCVWVCRGHTVLCVRVYTGVCRHSDTVAAALNVPLSTAPVFLRINHIFIYSAACLTVWHRAASDLGSSLICLWITKMCSTSTAISVVQVVLWLLC